MKPSISVITPAHDCAKYLPECVQSVALQKNVAVEHIIVDDASNDDTRRIMKELGEAHSHLRLEFLDSNIGQARARNFALSRAEGHYIFFLDADDMLEGQDALSELLESAQSNDADLVHFQYNRMPESETRITHAQNALTGERRAGVTLFSYPKLLNNTSCWQMLYRRRFLREQNLLFSHTLRQREDRPFFL
jgi:glycosyltransferase involved in cell wall biosynthesis